MQPNIKSSSHYKKTRERNKMHPVWKKKKVKQFLFVVDMIAHVENLKESTNKHLELKLINECSKISESKINTHRSITFLYTSNKHVEIKLKICLFNHSEENEILRYHLNRTWRGLCAENSKMLLKEDPNKTEKHTVLVY